MFGPHVTRWIDGSSSALCARCKQLENAAGGFVAHAERLPDGADGAQSIFILARSGSMACRPVKNVRLPTHADGKWQTRSTRGVASLICTTCK